MVFRINPEIPENKTNPWLKFLGYFGGPISYLLEVSAILSAVLAKDDPDHWIDFGILVVVLIGNAVIGFSEEAKAESALDALKANLALNTRCWRNGQLVEVEASLLVPGDIIALRLGDIVPADCRLLGIGVTGEESGPLSIDQAALTGESLPVQKSKDEVAFSSSIIQKGQQLGIVTKTGINTYIGRAANLISITNDEGHFQKIIKVIGDFLVVITLVMVFIVFLFEILYRKKPVLEALSKVVILTIASIPVGLPTVMNVTMAVGASQLAKKNVIVKRLTAIEELASVSILCSDKTGTLTMNKLSVDKPFLANKGNTSSDFIGTGVQYTEEELMLNSYMSSEPGAQDPIESTIRKTAEERVNALKDQKQDHSINGFKVTSFVPFDPSVKYTEATVLNTETQEKFKVIKGAPQVITKMCGNHKQGDDAVVDLAGRGLRALGVARTIDPEMTKFEFIGLISLLDPPREDSAETIAECYRYGIQVKMITGDQLIIAKEVAKRLGMQRTILDCSHLSDKDEQDVETMTDRVIKCDGFAHVIPEHKFKVVELMQSRGLFVGMTGDGVNDAPALKKANVGIAVEGCTDAARSAADIVLLAPGLSTIIDGIKTSRAIFQRMRSYALYRIASTIHFLLFFFISIIAYDFVLPSRLILMIAVLNDVATLVIAIDNAKISKRPDKWRLGQLITLSFILGVLLMGISFAHYFVAKSFPDLTEGQIETIMYLQISACPHFVIFSTRLATWWWTNLPSLFFFVAIMGTQVIAMLMAIFGVPALEATAIGPAWGFTVLAISMVMFMFLDVVKVIVFKIWSYELTVKLVPTPARKKTLESKKTALAEKKRIGKMWRKAAVMFHVAVATQRFKEAGVEYRSKQQQKQQSETIINV
jgi:H+-transporting ATPase